MSNFLPPLSSCRMKDDRPGLLLFLFLLLLLRTSLLPFLSLHFRYSNPREFSFFTLYTPHGERGGDTHTLSPCKKCYTEYFSWIKKSMSSFSIFPWRGAGMRAISERKKEVKKEIEVRRKKVSKVLGKCRVENTQILDPSVFFAKPCVTRRILHKY